MSIKINYKKNYNFEMDYRRDATRVFVDWGTSYAFENLLKSAINVLLFK